METSWALAGAPLTVSGCGAESFFARAPDHGNFYTDLLELIFDLHGWDPAVFSQQR